ncbi:cell division protein FtsK [Thermoclostridium stercorarium subsp. leptospartum DSM 9219]|uniref:Cell division protein FtsK n=1 Tax=Thermoclostridium stercorarium subsp. leptospartum DSM 9219 TaxID=1346611 RepID=A0A1B1YKQ0_THEST|nr:DNA translocase FtsK [Thermoclostridium stercorarium]ANX01348.1 cell division protein FtsK [Thermoclostridium stercorarium subsp. leptospartum DSM 9219]
MPERVQRKKTAAKSAGAKKNVKKRNTKGKTGKVKKVRSRNEISGVFTIAFGILFALSIYHKNLTGLFGEIIQHVSTGMFGFIAYLLPPFVIIYGILLIFYPYNRQIRRKLHLIFLLLVVIGAIFTAGNFNKSEYVNMTFFQYLKHFYKMGRNVSKIPYTLNGGVVGGLISVPLCLVFQKTGTIVLLGAFSIVVAMLITEISLKKMASDTADKVRRIRENRADMVEFIDEEDEDEPIFIKELDEPVNVKMRKKDSETAKIIDFPLIRNKSGKKSDGNADNQAHEISVKDEDDVSVNEIPIQVKDKKTETVQDIPAMADNEKPQAAVLEIPVQMKDEKAGTVREIPLEMKEEKSKQESENENVSGKEQEKIPVQSAEYRFPPFSCLNAPEDGGMNTKKLKQNALENAKKLEDTLTSFGIGAQIVNIAVGPAFTRFEVQPSPGVKVSRIVNLTDDIALSLAAQGIRIEAPIPGKSAVGIEVPNPEVAPIMLREVIETPEFVKFKSKLAVGLGKDISGENVIIDLAKMPHLLIAGATGSGKSVCINTIIISLLYKATPYEVKLLMIDPKVVELGVYNGIPHLLIPVVTDPSKAAGALQWAVQEMMTRYKLFADKGVRDLNGYNRAIEEEGEGFKLPQIVIIIDELADLMMVAPHDVEDSICRLAQMARAAGMHLVIATQRPSVNVITGVIKANIPSRIAFAVSSQVDSRTILDMSGAEKLLGKGDMLYYPVGMPKPIRVKGCFISDKEIERVVEFVKNQFPAEYDEDIIDQITKKNDDTDNPELDADELLPQAIELVVECGQASVSLIQRRFRVGYARAGRIIDQMAERGIISGFEGSKPRRVLITKEQWEEMKMNM